MEPRTPSPSPEQEALQNPIILQKIFQTKRLPVKNLRLVCQSWNQIILSLPEPKLCFDLMNPHGSGDPLNCCTTAPLELVCLKMEPKLARCILDEASHSKRICSSASRLLHVCPIFSQVIEEIVFTFVDEDLIWTMYETLQNFCPNLKKIYFQVYGMRQDYARSQNMAPFWIRPKLTSIEIYGYDFGGRNDFLFLKMVQMIINAAPNLTRFVYRGDRYPDLSHCGKIKSIMIDMSFMNLAHISSCAGANGLNKMLDQVKTHLQVLVMDNVVSLYDKEDDLDVTEGIDLVAEIAFKIPKMPSLIKFENQLVDGFTCGDNLEDICTARLPSLETLKLGKSYPYYFPSNLDDLLKRAIQSKNLFSGVKNLVLTDVRDVESINGLGQVFTNLQSFSILNWESYGKETEKKFAHAIQWVACCDDLPPTLKTFDLQVFPWLQEVGAVSRGVERMKMFLGVIKRNKLPHVTIKYVKFTEEVWQWMDPFIRDNQIPIKFEIE
ncbi:uncharacterized protein LOC110850308 [Folsomia candida]|nr:uncharacterized protein LOC110850308 [Folsomia candida]XP_035708038.1 uncharacterized protein LOC110850308 [Folsomia candida]